MTPDEVQRRGWIDLQAQVYREVDRAPLLNAPSLNADELDDDPQLRGAKGGLLWGLFGGCAWAEPTEEFESEPKAKHNFQYHRDAPVQI